MLQPWTVVFHTPLLLPWHTENREWAFCRCTNLPERQMKITTHNPQSFLWAKRNSYDCINDGEKLITRQQQINNRQETFNLTGKACMSSEYFTLGIWKRLHRIVSLTHNHNLSPLFCAHSLLRDYWGWI